MHARHDETIAPRPAIGSPAPAAGGRGWSLLAWARRLRRSRVERRAEAALASMDEHLLRDIGARRGDLATLVRQGRN